MISLLLLLKSSTEQYTIPFSANTRAIVRTKRFYNPPYTTGQDTAPAHELSITPPQWISAVHFCTPPAQEFNIAPT